MPEATGGVKVSPKSRTRYLVLRVRSKHGEPGTVAPKPFVFTGRRQPVAPGDAHRTVWTSATTITRTAYVCTRTKIAENPGPAARSAPSPADGARACAVNPQPRRLGRGKLGSPASTVVPQPQPGMAAKKKPRNFLEVSQRDVSPCLPKLLYRE